MVIFKKMVLFTLLAFFTTSYTDISYVYAKFGQCRRLFLHDIVIFFTAKIR